MRKFPSYRFHKSGKMCLCYNAQDAIFLEGWTEIPPDDIDLVYESVDAVPEDLLSNESIPNYETETIEPKKKRGRQPGWKKLVSEE